jgi:acetyl/propionyl-CoA carboxylase alpha subunit
MGCVDGIVRLVGQVGCPVMIKAVAGGSGRGMRIVRDPTELEAKIGEAQREAESAFGNGQVIAEQFLEHPRHIEVQVFGDNHGNVIHFGERDCSTQRRNQKLVEESPAPNLDPQLRSQILESAVKLASAVGYVGAGTVECILPSSGDRFYFLEMNTRIQVEHPVTELVAGVDLVALQLRVAGGESLSLRQDDVRFSGHAIEYRIYAEQPANDFRPALGRIEYMLRPGGIGVREDSWAEAGTVISPYYDSLISKVIVSGQSRNEAVLRSRRVLDEFVIDGVDTSLPFHRALVRHSDFQNGLIDVGWIGRNCSSGSIIGSNTAPRPSAVGPIEVPRRKTTQRAAVKKRAVSKSTRSSKPAATKAAKATKATGAAGKTKALRIKKIRKGSKK